MTKLALAAAVLALSVAAAKADCPGHETVTAQTPLPQTVVDSGTTTPATPAPETKTGG